MAKTTQYIPHKIALISAPWPLYTRPSIQLGALKAYLGANLPGVQVITHHFFLKIAERIGYKLYHEISERTWLAESIYAALLHPERFSKIEAFFYRQAGKNKLLQKQAFANTVKAVKEATDDFITTNSWGGLILAGFSVSMCQLSASLYLINKIKKAYPQLTVVVGGSTFSGVAAKDLLKQVPQVDAVVCGEGELPLAALVQAFTEGSRNVSDLPDIPSILTRRQTTEENYTTAFRQMDNLAALPPPDYDDYFNLLKTFKPVNRFFPTLPVEASRGCWWQPTTVAAKTSGCAFCNLNLQWSGYRQKASTALVSEIDHLTSRHQSLSVAFMDNVLPHKSSGAAFKLIGDLNKDLRLFGEIRADTSLQTLQRMRVAGMSEVQIGIEALSSDLLKRLHKGTSAIQNLEIMRNCEALGIANISNLIVHFPGSSRKEVDDTLQAIDFALPYRPLKPVGFWLGLGSPVWQNPKKFGIKAIYNHPHWGCLFPQALYRSIHFMIQAYRGDLGHQKKLWRPVQQKVKKWEQAYGRLHCNPLSQPILSFRDGGDFLIIRQRRYDTEPMTHRLSGASRRIYLFCQKHRSLKKIRDQFPSIPEDQITGFLKMMVDKKLMFVEREKYLSLAVSLNPVSESGI